MGARRIPTESSITQGVRTRFPGLSETEVRKVVKVVSSWVGNQISQGGNPASLSSDSSGETLITVLELEPRERKAKK